MIHICYHFKVQLLLIHKSITELEKLWMKQHTLKEVSPSVFFFSFCTTCYKQFAVLLLKSRALRRPSLKVTTMGPQPLWSNKVHIFWEVHKILRNLHLTFDWHYKSKVEISQNFVAFPEYMSINTIFISLQHSISKVSSRRVTFCNELWNQIAVVCVIHW